MIFCEMDFLLISENLVFHEIKLDRRTSFMNFMYDVTNAIVLIVLVDEQNNEYSQAL